MRLEDIRNNPVIMMHLRFDLTAEKLAIPKEAPFNPENAGFYFCIYVRKGRACLSLMHCLPNGTTTQECVAGFPEDMIMDALNEAGGKLSEGGYDSKYYPINKPIEKLLRLGIYAARRRRNL